MAEELTLQDAFGLLLRRWKLIFGATLASSTIALIIALVLPPIYHAEVLLIPGDSAHRSKGGFSGFGGELDGLASLAGLNLSGGDQKNEAIATLTSRTLTETFIHDQNLLPILFSGQWDAQANQWKNASDPKKVPTLWDGNELFKRSVRHVSEDRKTGLITLAIEWKDAQLASDWANELVRRTNIYLRQQAIERSQRNIRFLEEQLKKTSMVEIRQSLYRLLESELRMAMLAEGSSEYAFRVIDAAAVPQKKARPKRRVIVLSGFFIGLIGSLILVLVFPPPRPAP